MIREAIAEDFETILDMCATFWLDTQFTEPFDREHTRKMVQMSLDHGLLITAIEEGEVIGFMAAIKSPLLGSMAAWMATELAWYVTPANRGKMAGIEMVLFLERLCKLQEVKYLNLAFMETSMPEQVKSMYKKLGYQLQETIYTKVL